MSKGGETHTQDLKTLNAAFKGYTDGSIDFYGDQIEAATGFTRRAFQTREVIWTDLIVEDDRLRTREIFIAALKGNKTYTRQYRIRDKAGAILWIQEWSQIVCSHTGQIDYITGIIVDITAAKTEELAMIERERRTGKYLTFTLGGEDYGIGLTAVREIVEILPITPVPHVSAAVKGVINLRGKVLPIVDLKERLGVEGESPGERRCIIVVEVARAEGTLLAGLLVDGVSDVLFIKGENIEDTPSTLSRSSTDYILGMAKIENRVRLLIDVSRTVGALDRPIEALSSRPDPLE